MQFVESVMHAMDSRWTVEDGMKRTFSRVRCEPFSTTSLMKPIPMALIDEPFTPLTTQFEIGLSIRKSDLSGKMCVVQPLLSRSGDCKRKTSFKCAWGSTGATEIAATSIFLLLCCQSTDALRSPVISNQAMVAYSSWSAGDIESATSGL